MMSKSLCLSLQLVEKHRAAFIWRWVWVGGAHRGAEHDFHVGKAASRWVDRPVGEHRHLVALAGAVTQ